MSETIAEGTRMTFAEAQKELDGLASGEYRIISYTLTNTGTKQHAECVVYIHGHGHHSGSTWRESLDSMKNSINPRPCTIDTTEAPTGENH